MHDHCFTQAVVGAARDKSVGAAAHCNARQLLRQRMQAMLQCANANTAVQVSRIFLFALSIHGFPPICTGVRNLGRCFIDRYQENRQFLTCQ